MQSRRFAIALVAVVAPAMILLAACGAKTASKPVTTDDMSMGDLKSPVTVIEYASVACPYCAQFNNEEFPEFKKRFIDTGQIHYVSREMLTHNGAVAAAGFLLARCAGPDNYFKVVDAIYHARDDMEQNNTWKEGLLKIASSVGINEAQFNACTTDPKAIEALNTRIDGYMKNDGVNSTPSFVINGKLLDTGGLPTMDDFAKAITAARAAGPVAAPAAAPAATPPAPPAK